MNTTNTLLYNRVISHINELNAWCQMTTEQDFSPAFFYFSKELHINSNKPRDVVVCEVCQLVVKKGCMKAHEKSKKHCFKTLGI